MANDFLEIAKVLQESHSEEALQEDALKRAFDMAIESRRSSLFRGMKSAFG